MPSTFLLSRALTLASVLASLALCASACGDVTTPQDGGGPLDAADYDQSCSTDADCVAVPEGPIECCSSVSCSPANAAINKGALPQFEADFQADFPTNCGDIACPAICAINNAQCSQGKCAVMAP
jgi:hypothetical protein